MEKVKNNLLEESEATAMVVGFIIGTAILALPNGVVQRCKAGWMDSGISWWVISSIYSFACYILCQKTSQPGYIGFK